MEQQEIQGIINALEDISRNGEQVLYEAVAFYCDELSDTELNDLYGHSLINRPLYDPSTQTYWAKSSPLFTEHTHAGPQLHELTRKQVLTYCLNRLGY